MNSDWKSRRAAAVAKFNLQFTYQFPSEAHVTSLRMMEKHSRERGRIGLADELRGIIAELVEQES